MTLRKLSDDRINDIHLLSSMGKRVLKEFIQSLHNRIIVAVSFTVFKSKPAHVTAEQHAESLQQLVYENWVKESYVSSFENKIIELQNEKLFTDIIEQLRPKEPTHFFLGPEQEANLLSRIEEDATLVLNKLDGSFPSMCLEIDTPDKSVPGVYSVNTLVEPVPDVSSEDDAQSELIPGVYSVDTLSGSFPDVCSEEGTQDELMSVLSSEEDTQDELIPGVCSEEYQCDEINETESDFDDCDLFENNVSFIQAMIQLKFSSESVTLDIIHNILDKLVKNTNLHKHDIGNVEGLSDGPIFEELSACSVADLNVDQIRIIINSSRTEYLIKKCLTSVLHFAYKNIHNNTDAIFYSWHGSIMEHLCSVLEDISFHPVCSEFLSKLILKSLDDIWSSEDSRKHIIWEHQHQILYVFCVNSHVCERVLDFITVKFDILIDLINTIQSGTYEHLVGIHVIEKLPHFARFSCMVIKKLQFYKTAEICHNENQIKFNKSEKVTDLWKLKWRVNDVNELDHKTKLFQHLLKRWKDICEKLIIISANNFPLISGYIWDIMKTLQDWDPEI